jgi:hypothetical protein
MTAPIATAIFTAVIWLCLVTFWKTLLEING